MSQQDGTERAEHVEDRSKKPATTRIPGATKWLAILSIIVWFLASVALWISGAVDETSRWAKYIYEPAVVGLSLGFVAIAWFAAIYFREGDFQDNADNRLRSAIAGSVVLLFCF
jgi:hypothetical protein